MGAIALASTSNMSRDEWHKWRRLGIGGSDASAVAGLNRWRGPIEVWMEKMGKLEPRELGEAAYWGTTLEDIVAKEFAKRSGLKVQKRNAILRHPKYEFMLANLDRVINDSEKGKGILECKTAGEYSKSEWDDGNIPEEYALQVHHYLAVTGYSFARIAVLIGGNKFEVRDIERDEEIIDYLVKIESDFWQLVREGRQPELNEMSVNPEVLKLLYPESNGLVVSLSDDVEKLVEQFKMLQEMEKEIVTKKDEMADRIKSHMGANEIGRTPNYKLNWKSIISRRFDTASFKTKHKDLYDMFSSESSSRRFTVAKVK